jgi:CRISPR-associated protein Csd1
MQCLVTGKRFSDPDLFPKIKRVPGVAGDTSLVSYNAGAFLSYGLKSNENAPVSRDAAESIATALNRLLHPAYPVPGRNPPTLKSRMFRIADDTGFCYWSRNPDSAFANSLDDLLSVTSESVREEVWQRLWRGRPPEGTVDLTPFYGLVITGTTGRAILREWFETTVGEAQKSVADHFHDLALVRNAPWKKGEDPPPAIGIRTLLESIAEQGDLGNVPRVLASQFLRAALTGCLYPFGILTRAVERARAEIGNDDWAGLQRRDARAAIIKAVLNRRHRLQPRPNSTEVHEEMDPHNTNPGYVLGCLIAVLERLQQEALGDVNASVIDKYFAGASAAPRATFDRLVKNARHHAKKAKDGDNPGIVMRLEKLIDELISSINVDHKLSQKAYRPIGFPLTLPIEQQGLFVIGYHHMRHFLWLNAERRAEWEASHPSAAPAYLWQSKKTTSAAA